MEKCFQVSSSMVSSTSARASVLHYSHHHSFPFSMQDKKVNNFLPSSCNTNNRLTAAAVSFPSSGSRNLRRPALGIVCKASVDTVQVVTDTTWDSLVLGSELPAIVDFWAPWCGPCRMIAPIIDDLAKEYAGKVNCFKLNTDESPNVAGRYGIRSIPTVLFFKDGEKKESIIGAVPKSTLSNAIDKYV
ncbi:Thioredoxin domain-containing protein [Heracleum sosnowskyi]|uniref:Thioredoxin domain-containing protein n=1 Tax=Heracleum sosnowskyi TaxID=360622 RepID=A0AAD8MF61_9APIA|nr:Thioredoxin domain-containing protein [Heracleum sosnowskyi]